MCVPCACDSTGSLFSQCRANGSCVCREGVTGRYCDSCKRGYFGFSDLGCIGKLAVTFIVVLCVSDSALTSNWLAQSATAFTPMETATWRLESAFVLQTLAAMDATNAWKDLLVCMKCMDARQAFQNPTVLQQSGY